MKIGFIGLGIMGKPMVKNLLKAGHELVVFNRSRPGIDECVAAGAKAAASPRDVGARCRVVITMVTNSPDVMQVVAGENGVLEGAKPGALVIDMSSIAPGAAREAAARCAEKGVDMLDAPVSGGENGAIRGSLTIMVGGDKDVFERVKDDILLKMGAVAVHCGDIGAGNATKLVNQVIVAGNLAALAEGITLARKLGVDPGVALDAVRGGMAGSRILQDKGPLMLSGEYRPGFKLGLHIKDMHNALDAAHDAGSPLVVTPAIVEMMHILRADGHGDEDHSVLARYYEKVCGGKGNS